MKGFLIEKDGKSVAVAVRNGIISIIADYVHGEGHIDVGGRDESDRKRYKWLRETLKEGDSFKVTFCEIEKVSQPISSVSFDADGF
ncbi:MAG: hypothetical protein NC115_00410 [Bacteroidales bacterium]|nr:hypothetical protein [Bacteroidales bacterium]